MVKKSIKTTVASILLITAILILPGCSSKTNSSSSRPDSTSMNMTQPKTEAASINGSSNLGFWQAEDWVYFSNYSDKGKL